MSYRQEHEDKVICPHCLYKQDGEDDLNEAEDGAVWECRSCHKSFRIETVQRVTVVTTLKETDVLLNEFSLSLSNARTRESNGLNADQEKEKAQELSMKIAHLLLKERHIDETTY